MQPENINQAKIVFQLYWLDCIGGNWFYLQAVVRPNSLACEVAIFVPCFALVISVIFLSILVHPSVRIKSIGLSFLVFKCCNQV